MKNYLDYNKISMKLLMKLLMKLPLPISIKAYKLICLFVPMFLISCGEVIVETINNEVGYSPCSIDVSVAAVGAPIGTDDPLEAYQWYLQENYANVTGAWEMSADGAGIEIGVVDDAVQLDHEDLNRNVEPGASVNVFVAPSDANARNPYPSDCVRNGHGTSVSGIIAATADNGRGIKGIAYNATIWGANLILNNGFSGNELARALGNRVVQTDVLSNSWGYASPTFLSPASSNFITLIETGLTTGSHSTGSDPKGISYVFAAGNDGDNRDSSERDNDGRFIPIDNSGDRSSYSEILNHQGVIVACSVGSDDMVSSYSEPGPNLWLCGYSSSGRQPSGLEAAEAHNPIYSELFGLGLPTLDLSGSAGYNDGGNTRFAQPEGGGACLPGGALFNFGAAWELLPPCSDTAPPWLPSATSSYHRYFTGTSAATPMVSGVIGLMRAANSALTWRDVKLILAESAREPDGVNGFVMGASTYSNGTINYTYNDAYGFGIVDAAAAVALAKKWTPVSQDMVKWMPSSVSVTPAIAVPATATTNINFIEYVQAEIQGGQSEPNFGALDIRLTSPSGKESIFALLHQCATVIGSGNTFATTNDCPVFNNARTFTFGAANFLGEDPAGTWTLVATRAGVPLNLNWKLIIHGHQR